MFHNTIGEMLLVSVYIFYHQFSKLKPIICDLYIFFSYFVMYLHNKNCSVDSYKASWKKSNNWLGPEFNALSFLSNWVVLLPNINHVTCFATKFKSFLKYLFKVLLPNVNHWSFFFSKRVFFFKVLARFSWVTSF